MFNSKKNNKMKINYIFGITVILIVLSTISCKDMDLNPHDKLAEGTFWQSESDVELALAGMYDQLKAGEPWGANSFLNSFSLPAFDAISDNAFTQHGRLGLRNAMVAPINSQTGGIVTDFYGIAYKQIATSNYFLENIDKVPSDNADAINQAKGEAQFFRGLMYYYLSEFYGDVPIVLNSYELNEQLKMKSSKADVVEQALKDIDFAIANLEDKPYSDGRVNMGAAQAIKVRILMANNNWADAASLSKSIWKDGQFSLSPEFNSLFTAGEQAGNPEIIFSVKYLKPNKEHIGSLNWGWWMSVSPLQNLIDEFEMTDGMSIATSPLYDPDNPYLNRDPRMVMTADVPGSDNDPGSVFGFPDENGGEDIMWKDRVNSLPSPLMYNLRKYADRTFQASVDASNHCDTDYVILRLGEVILNYAEAQNEATGPDATVYEAVNAIRGRVGMPDLPTGLSQDDMRTAIRHERRVELAFEGMRWLDLKRWGTLVERINSVDATQVPVAYTHSDNNVLWPIPQSEIDFYTANDLDLGQNPGY